ncbi:MAG: hypothetical protein ACLP7I_12070 [Limisphaerales bacterium]
MNLPGLSSGGGAMSLSSSDNPTASQSSPTSVNVSEGLSGTVIAITLGVIGLIVLVFWFTKGRRK